MTGDGKRRLGALRSYARKQSGDLEQARLVHARLRDAQDRAEQALREATARVHAVEALLRQQADPDRPLALDAWRRGRAYLAGEAERLRARAEERDRAEERVDEAGAWLARCARELEATERLGERTRAGLEAEQRRRDYRENDELWLVARSGRA